MGELFIDVPAEIREFLVIEDSSSFREEKYYFSVREKQLYDHIVQQKKVAEKFEEMGIKQLNATLLYGKSGTGKTTLGRYLAFKLQVPFAYLNFAKIISGDYGGTSRNIGKIFEFINGKECVFMLDEIDCISRNRQAAGEVGSMENARITITLMQELDKIKNSSIILGATNILRTLDPALIRRFPLLHEVERFSTLEMEEFIKKYLDNVNVDYDKRNITLYCKSNSRISQANIVSDINRVLAGCIVTGNPFYLEHLGVGQTT